MLREKHGIRGIRWVRHGESKQALSTKKGSVTSYKIDGIVPSQTAIVIIIYKLEEYVLQQYLNEYSLWILDHYIMR